MSELTYLDLPPENEENIRDTTRLHEKSVKMGRSMVVMEYSDKGTGGRRYATSPALLVTTSTSPCT